MKLSDHEIGYYIGIAYCAKMYQDMIEDLQERGLDPYKIIDAILFSNAKLREEAIQIVRDSGYEVKEQDDSHSENP